MVDKKRGNTATENMGILASYVGHGKFMKPNITKKQHDGKILSLRINPARLTPEAIFSCISR
jgi:hypothetical protein